MNYEEWVKNNSYYRVRIRKQNGRTEIIPVKFESKETAVSFAEKMNQSQCAADNGYRYEYAGSKLY